MISLSTTGTDTAVNTHRYITGMARVPDAAVLGLLAGLLGMTATDAFHQQHLMRQASSPLSEAPALGAWLPRPRRGGVVLHARWPFGRRGRDAEKEEVTQDSTQQVRCVAAGRNGSTTSEMCVVRTQQGDVGGAGGGGAKGVWPSHVSA